MMEFRRPDLQNLQPDMRGHSEIRLSGPID